MGLPTDSVRGSLAEMWTILTDALAILFFGLGGHHRAKWRPSILAPLVAWFLFKNDLIALLGGPDTSARDFNLSILIIPLSVFTLDYLKWRFLDEHLKTFLKWVAAETPVSGSKPGKIDDY